LLFNPEDSEQNYVSRAYLGKSPNGASECGERSCSLWTSAEAAKAAQKIGFFRTKKVAILNVPEGSGVHVIAKTGHIDFWMYKDFNPLSSVWTVVERADDVERAVHDG
jgi:hypothetical protein